MGRLIYSMNTSLDGYVADTDGRFDWMQPDPEVHVAINDLMRTIQTHLYGRRLYEVMRAWETMDLTVAPDYMVDFARLWHSAEKVVHSSSLSEVRSPRTRLVRDFDPVEVGRSVRAAPGDTLIGGPDLASTAMRAGLVDTIHLFVAPLILGGGTSALPQGLRQSLVLRSSHTFDSGVVHHEYTWS